VATNFLEAAGTNGFINTPFNLLSTELNSLADSTSATSSVGGTSGVFSQTNYANAIWAYVYLTLGGSFTPAAGSPDLLGWFLFSPDGGSTFEDAVSSTDMPRPADFIIPAIGSNAYSSGNILVSSGLVRVPFSYNKVFVMSHFGATLPSSSNTLKAGPVAIQY
jgi:hypothetical protein